jgi:hypothetical protein
MAVDDVAWPYPDMMSCWRRFRGPKAASVTTKNLGLYDKSKLSCKVQNLS